MRLKNQPTRAEFLLKPVKPSLLMAVVERLLADARAGRAIPRRWPRKPVMQDVRVDIDDAAVRMLDVSYGGVCVEMRRSAGSGPPGEFRMIVPPADLPVPVEVVWSRRRDATTWLCGGVVSQENVTNWRTLVDLLP